MCPFKGAHRKSTLTAGTVITTGSRVPTCLDSVRQPRIRRSVALLKFYFHDRRMAQPTTGVVWNQRLIQSAESDPLAPPGVYHILCTSPVATVPASPVRWRMAQPPMGALNVAAIPNIRDRHRRLPVCSLRWFEASALALPFRPIQTLDQGQKSGGAGSSS